MLEVTRSRNLRRTPGRTERWPARSELARLAVFIEYSCRTGAVSVKLVAVIDKLEPASLAEAAKQPTHPSGRGAGPKTGLGSPYGMIEYGVLRLDLQPW